MVTVGNLPKETIVWGKKGRVNYWNKELNKQTSNDSLQITLNFF